MTFQSKSARRPSQVNELSLGLPEQPYKCDCWATWLTYHQYYLDHLGPVDPGLPTDTELEFEEEMLGPSRNISSAPIDEAREALQKLRGVGLLQFPSGAGEHATSQRTLFERPSFASPHMQVSEETPPPNHQVSDDTVEIETGDCGSVDTMDYTYFQVKPEGSLQGRLKADPERHRVFVAETPISSTYGCVC